MDIISAHELGLVKKARYKKKLLPLLLKLEME